MENRADYLLESYFANALTSAEATELKTLAASDPKLAAELVFQQQLAATFQSRSLADGIQNTAWRSAAQRSFPASAIKVTMWPRYAVAAAIALLIVAYLVMQPKGLDTALAEGATKFPNNLPYKNMGEAPKEYSSEAIAALTLYDNNQFAAASKALESIVAAEPNRMDYRFYWGVSLIKEKKYANAVVALQPVTQSQDERKTPALYFLGLACAGSGDQECARQSLEAYKALPDGDPTRKKQADVILDAL